jgi:anti-sigma-K factor RskA
MSVQPPFDDPLGGGGGPPNDDLLAAELVLAVLDGPARRSALERMERDPAFCERVRAWERQFSPWLNTIRPERAPEHLWLGITRRLGWSEQAAGHGGLWQSIAFWRAATALVLLAALALWFLRPAFLPPGNESALNRPVTTLTQSDGRAGWLASIDAARGTLLIVPVPRAPDALGRVPELWVIPAGQAPRSLGAVSLNRSSSVIVPGSARAALAAPGSLLAITLEPPSGIPHAVPSGPVIASGPIHM